MKRVTKFLLATTLLEVILSQQTNENELKSMFEKIKCEFDLSPFSDEDLNFDEKENKIIMEIKENKKEQTKTLKSGNKEKEISVDGNKVVKTLTVEGEVTNRVTKFNEVIVEQYQIFDNVNSKTYERLKNGKITKEDKQRSSIIIVKNNEFNSDVVNFEISERILQKHCTKKINRDIIKSVIFQNKFIQTAIRFANGKYFYAFGHKDNSIITMGQYQNSLKQNLIFSKFKLHSSITVGDYKYVEKIMNNNFENKDLVEDLLFKKMIDFKESDFPNQLRHYTNNGIIMHYDFIMVSDRYQSVRHPSQGIYDLFARFQKDSYSDFEILDVFNIRHPGLLFCLTSNQELYKTSHMMPINIFLENNSDEYFFWCEFLSYMSPDSKQLWIKNYGIIENGKLVKESKNLFKNENVFTYVDGETRIMWND